MMESKLKVASLFCGCGGSDLGMVGGFDYLGKRYEELPFEIVYAVDFDPWAVETYNCNFSHSAIVGDVTEEDFNTVPDVDVLIGGFPCQSFSTVNPTKDTEDDRAHLYKQIVRFLQIKRPKYFICENVKGLITLKGGSIVKKIISEFEDCGYHVEYRLLKAVEYGIPQRRERVIIVGIRNDINTHYTYPKSICTEENAVPLSSVIDKLDIETPKYYFSEKAVQGVKNAKNNMKRGLWQDLDKPCLTITAHLAKTSMNSRDPILLVDPSKELYRRFTPREAARIQSFPDDFILNRSEPKSYKQIGNAVPPVLMWYVAKQLGAMVFDQTPSFEMNSRCFAPQQTARIREYRAQKPQVIKQLNFLDVIEQYPDTTIVDNSNQDNHDSIDCNSSKIDLSKNVLVSYVKADNIDLYLDQSAKVYYTGKRFPSTVALNKLYYFMPYMKGKGIRDLYFIKIARVGNRKEGQPGEDKNDFRLVFEIEFVKQLFDDYKPIELEIWHTFTDTTLGGVVGN